MGAYRGLGVKHEGRMPDGKRGRFAVGCDLTKPRAHILERRLEFHGIESEFRSGLGRSTSRSTAKSAETCWDVAIPSRRLA